MSRTCSQCGNNGHNSRTCTDGENGGIMLFGVRLTEGNNNNNSNNCSFRKSVSMNNLSQYDQHPPQDSNVAEAGYVSDDVVHASGRTRERKRGVPWTEEEHKMFLLGLQQVGKGDWRGISRNFVKTRTPTQVASHAQKYFLRRHNQNRRRRRSSLFDITTDTVMESSTIMEREEFQQETTVSPPNPRAYASHYGGIPCTAFPMSLAPAGMLPVASGERPAKPIRPTAILPVPPSTKMANLNLKEKATPIEPLPLSLKLPLPSSPPQQQSSATSGHSSPSSSSSSSSAFQSMTSGKFSGGGDSIISVA